jgi:IS30 family transposase
VSEITQSKRNKIEDYLRKGRSQNEITKLCSCSKATVQKVKRSMESATSPNGIPVVPPSQETPSVSVEDVDKYVKKCLKNPKLLPNTALLNTALKLLELKNKIEPEALKKMRDEEQAEFTSTIGDAIDYLHTIRPDYEIKVPSEPDSDDKTSRVEG